MLKFIFKYFVELTGNPYSSSILKSFAKSKCSKPLIRPFANTYQINQNEMKLPIHQYGSLHDFFTRQLKDNLRPIDASPNTLISPVDGVLSDMGPIMKNQTFFIKDRLYQLDHVLGSKERAKKYEDGFFYILYLSPRHYHRFHYPISGTLHSRYALGEKSFPVNSLGMRWGDALFATNYRLISELQTEFGNIAMVKVGALNINSIQLIHSEDKFTKGEELGYFSFGSTVILFIEKNSHSILL
ncbi:phosphatidylserine decarboxylase [Paracerasibacillus soli]|uniref:phosphatidylserine decarboxylase n=1 Tax=Paracerasibacillus soli TaxID=480284 RepID=A0ABU5CWV8_9BACI|nr:phosphatidylserine decarboxylase [Virgibacillus soli]MDY0410324.1 phosphatidylserine decarboxylase [Virgibacillus soli]